MKTEGAARGFQHRPRNPAIHNARKKHVRSLLLHKVSKKSILERYIRCIILALFCFDSFTSAHGDNSHLYPRSRAISKQLLNHGGKLARSHHVVAEFTKCSGCLPSILIVDNCIFFTFRRQVRLCSSPFRPVSISIFILATDTGNTNGPEMDNLSCASTARAHANSLINTWLFSRLYMLIKSVWHWYLCNNFV